MKIKGDKMEVYPFKSLKLRNSLKILIALTSVIIAGCAGEAVRVEIPLSHPANAQAPEAKFSPPQNPFQTDIAVMEEESETDSKMKHNMHEAPGKQKMDHNMGIDKMNRSGSESKN
jgi:hypothetical protein